MTDANLGVLIALLVLAIPLVALAKRVDVSYPIVLVASGLVLGFIPGLPSIQLSPDIVLLVFLPPLLYWEAITAPTDIMLENASQIGLLAIGLVIVTTVAVAVTAHAIVPAMPWSVAFVLGAIVSPTDELAAIPVLEHFRLPRHVIAIVDGESLLNDATALVIYATAVTAVTTGAFAMGPALLQFALDVVGSLAIGFLAGRVGVELWRRIKDRQLQGVVSFTLPFLAYYPAQHFGLSGVLAVVTAGVYANHFTPKVMTPAARTQIVGFWNTLVFLANAGLFLVVGLQLHALARNAFERNSWPLVIGSTIAVNAVLIVVRLVLVVAAEYAPTTAPADHAAPDWRHALVVGWSGLRGAVSLAAALAIPLLLPSGAPFPNRDLILFITFSVIVVTLVGGGLTLPTLVRRLHIVAGDEEGDELRKALIASAEAAIARIGELQREGRLDDEHADLLREQYEHKRDLHSNPDDGAKRDHIARHITIESELIEAQRRAVIELRARGEIDNVVLRRVQSDLDLAATRKGRV
jgi:CPA1 family monovalent cation:H+ antiporter